MRTEMETKIDPVCGMSVDPARAAATSEFEGTTYYFCNPRCKTRFDANPSVYLKDERPVAEVNEGTWWICPMHPEVRQKTPGACPKCGMALEPETITASQVEDNPELKDMTRRFRVSVVFTAPLIIFAMTRHMPGVHDLLGHAILIRASWIELALATPVVLW